ncbi:MAG: hypothetical protein IK999_04225 [Ruminococcus sp.]|nr:hypothetical protein [Ruminococcus sp.]
MRFRLTAKKKLSNVEFAEPVPVKAAGDNGEFEAQALPFARTQCNAFIQQWAEGMGLRVRSQKDWSKNAKTKNLERQVMMQDNGSPETYVFELETIG